MKRLSLLSRITCGLCLLYIAFDILCLVTFVPYIFGAIFRICLNVSYIVFLTLLQSKARVFRRPAIYIVVASSLAIINACINLYSSGLLADSQLPYVTTTGFIYLPLLIFFCMGFFKMAKLLPRKTWARRMAVAIPSVELLQLVLPIVWMLVLPNTVSRYFIDTIYLIQMVAIALFYYTIPKAVENIEQ